MQGYEELDNYQIATLENFGSRFTRFLRSWRFVLGGKWERMDACGREVVNALEID